MSTRNRPELAIVAAMVFLTLVVFAPLVPRYHAQPASRYALTAALADDQTVDLGRYTRILGVDHAKFDGRLRSDKAVGQPLLGVPAYLAGRAIGAEPAEDLRARGDLGMWWSTFWSALVPFTLLLAVMFLFARRFVPRHALPATLAIGFATMLLPHAVNLYGHVLAALFAFGAFVVAERAAPSAYRLAIAGALAGLAVSVEYHAVIAAAAVFVAIALRERVRGLYMVAGGMLPAFVVAWYQSRAFGAWWRTPFAFYGGTLEGTSEGGYTLPGWRNITAVFAGTRGLLYVSPIVLVAIGGAALLARSGRGDLRRHGILALVITGAYVVLCAGWSGTPLLEEPGPRYAIPALPFLVVPLASVWARWHRVVVVATAVGAAFMVAAASTFILLEIGESPLMYLRYVSNGMFATNLWTIALGPIGTACYLASIAVAVRICLRVVSAARSTPQECPEAGAFDGRLSDKGRERTGVR